MTNKDLHIHVPVTPAGGRYSIVILNWHSKFDFSGRLGIVLLNTADSSIFSRVQCAAPKTYSHEEVAKAALRTMYIQKGHADLPRAAGEYVCRLETNIVPHGYTLHAIAPSKCLFNWSILIIGLTFTRTYSILADGNQIYTIFKYANTENASNNYFNFLYKKLIN